MWKRLLLFLFLFFFFFDLDRGRLRFDRSRDVYLQRKRNLSASLEVISLFPPIPVLANLPKKCRSNSALARGLADCRPSTHELPADQAVLTLDEVPLGLIEFVDLVDLARGAQNCKIPHAQRCRFLRATSLLRSFCQGHLRRHLRETIAERAHRTQRARAREARSLRRSSCLLGSSRRVAEARFRSA